MNRFCVTFLFSALFFGCVQSPTEKSQRPNEESSTDTILLEKKAPTVPKLEKRVSRDYSIFADAVERNDLMAAQKAGADLLSAQKNDPVVFVGLARLFSKSGKKKRARFLIEQVLQQNSNNVDALYLRGQMAWSDEKHELALQDFHRVYALAPDYRAVTYNLAVIYLRSSVYSKAEKYWAELYQNDASLQSGLALAQVSLGLSKYLEAQKIYDQILRQSSLEEIRAQKNGFSLFDGYLRIIERQSTLISEKSELLSFVQAMKVAGLSERAEKLLKGR